MTSALRSGVLTCESPLPCDQTVQVAAEVMAQHLGITQAEAVKKLRSGPLDLGADGAHLRPLLVALGVAVPHQPNLFDLSLQAKSGACLENLALRLAPVVGLTESFVRARLASPGGLILTDLQRDAGDSLIQSLLRWKGLVAAVSWQRHAVLDLFCPAQMTPSLCRLLVDAQRLGFGPDAQTGALAAGLERRAAASLVRRHPTVDGIWVNRAFQRYDLFLIAKGDQADTGLVDFLAARSNQPRAQFKTVSPANPLRIEAGLTRSIMERFQGDYAGLGLVTQARLVGLTPVNT